MKSHHEYTEEEIKNQFKYLVENILKREINDNLPKGLTDKVLSDNDAYYMLRYANHNKGNHSYYKYFSNSAYLCNLVYPDKFRGCQFKHTNKTIEYFTKQNYAYELTYILEDKLGYSLKNLPQLISCHNFLSTNLLQYYGLGGNVYLKIFGDKKEMINYILKYLNVSVSESRKELNTTRQNRESLKRNEVNVSECFVSDCGCGQVEIHHIIKKADRNKHKFDIDISTNLIPLCPNHHKLIQKLDMKPWEAKFIKNNLAPENNRNREMIEVLIRSLDI